MSLKSDVPLVQESYDLPGSPGRILALIGSILRLGSVQEIRLRLGEPVQVSRYDHGGVVLDRSGLPPWKMVSVLPMAEVPPNTPGVVIYAMLALVAREGLVPSHFMATDGMTVLRKWAGVPVRNDSFLGTPLLQDKELPGDTLVLVGSPSHDSTLHEAMMCVKTTMVVEDLDDEALGVGIGGWPGIGGGGSAPSETGAAG